MLKTYGDALKEAGIENAKETDVAIYVISVLERCPEQLKRISQSKDKIDVDSLFESANSCEALSLAERDFISDQGFVMRSDGKDPIWIDILAVCVTISLFILL